MDIIRYYFYQRMRRYMEEGKSIRPLVGYAARTVVLLVLLLAIFAGCMAHQVTLMLHGH